MSELVRLLVGELNGPVHQANILRRISCFPSVFWGALLGMSFFSSPSKAARVCVTMRMILFEFCG